MHCHTHKHTTVEKSSVQGDLYGILKATPFKWRLDIGGSTWGTQGSIVQARSDSPRGTRKKPTVFQILTDKIFFLKKSFIV